MSVQHESIGEEEILNGPKKGIFGRAMDRFISAREAHALSIIQRNVPADTWEDLMKFKNGIQK